MNIDAAHTQYTSVRSDEWKTCLTKDECFSCDQKKHHHKNCFMNSYSKIWQIIAINANENILIKKTYIVFVTSLKTSDKRTCSSFLHIIISHIMFSDESENESFWNQVTFQNTREKNLWCVYVFWVLTRITEVTHFLIWLMKYNLRENELRHELW